MHLLRDLESLPEQFRRGAVSVGNFDGVHLGHARIVRRLADMARRVGGPAVVLTFDPHPARLLRPEAAPMPLCWTERKAELLSELGADVVVAYPTDPALLRLTAREFFDEILRGRFAARALVEGPNFFFGRDRGGNVEVLRDFCDEVGMNLVVVDPAIVDGELVSSSRVRRLVAAGRLNEAGTLLGRPYSIRGTVIRGAGRGTKLGYPTANLGGVDTLLPAAGIYAGQAVVGGTLWPAAVSLGPNPTFNEQALKVEAYLIGYQGDLYDQPLVLDFLSRLRDIQRFDTVDELVTEIERDVAAVRGISDWGLGIR